MAERQPIKPTPIVFWPLAILGWAVMVYGVIGLLSNASRTHPPTWAIWFFGAAFVHDLLLAPLVLSIGGLVARHAPARTKIYTQAVLIISAVVALSSIPVLLGFGRNPNDPSTLPNNYAAGLLAVLALVWVAIAIVSLSRRSHV